MKIIKTDKDLMAEYIEMIERGEASEYVYTATTVKPTSGNYLKDTSERDGKVTTHYLTV